MMPRVLNKTKDNITAGAIYVGRPSVFGNPFVIGRDGSRYEVIEMFERYLQESPDLLQRVKSELKGKDLVCFCSPKACHGDVLLKYANDETNFLELF